MYSHFKKISTYGDNLGFKNRSHYLFLLQLMDFDLSASGRLLTFELTMKYTQHNLDKIEKIVAESGYVIRYERGTFQSGYCILQDKKVVVLNKFFQTEGRINTLIDLLPQLNVNIDLLTHESQKLYEELVGVSNDK